ncbi:hypothetical protein GQ44DRAFT_623756 [Phaeosphaeriaceae sp. PMI808]|nr:hypothetical protein GQ44DRAFT_623756 [Phaeosphaeriaceae sp. PMI808]
MALFTKFKKAKEAAIEHKKTAAAQQAKSPAAPYRHIPTHAAQDALAAQPTTLKPAELRARTTKARERRASSYQPSVAARHSVYHSCESSRASSRANSTAGFFPASTSSSLKGKAVNGFAVDAAIRRSQSLSHRQSLPMTDGQLYPTDLLSAASGDPSMLTPPTTQRPRPFHSMSSRSSYAKKKSPLSNVSVDEEPPDVSSSSSDTSISPESSILNDSQRNNSNNRSVAEETTTTKPASSTQHMPIMSSTQSTSNPFAKRRSRWSVLPRKSIDIAAH